jgi:hypothetical protein
MFESEESKKSLLIHFIEIYMDAGFPPDQAMQKAQLVIRELEQCKTQTEFTKVVETRILETVGMVKRRHEALDRERHEALDRERQSSLQKEIMDDFIGYYFQAGFPEVLANQMARQVVWELWQCKTLEEWKERYSAKAKEAARMRDAFTNRYVAQVQGRMLLTAAEACAALQQMGFDAMSKMIAANSRGFAEMEKARKEGMDEYIRALQGCCLRCGCSCEHCRCHH